MTSFFALFPLTAASYSLSLSETLFRLFLADTAVFFEVRASLVVFDGCCCLRLDPTPVGGEDGVLVWRAFLAARQLSFVTEATSLIPEGDELYSRGMLLVRCIAFVGGGGNERGG